MTPQTFYWTSSKRLLREVIFGGYIENVSPLRVGAGREAPLGSPVDLGLLKVNYGGKTIPYIPGSSLKGTFRSQAEALAKTRGLSVCSGLSRSTCMDTKKYVHHEVGERSLSEYVEWRLRRKEDEEAMKAFFETSCLMCKIFGSPSYASKVTFSDAYPITNEGDVTAPPTGVKAGIAIDRRTGAVYRGALYQVEYIEPGAHFRLFIHSKNLPNYALGLFASILIRVKKGEVRLGGLKTRGFGEISIHDPYVKIRDFVSDPPQLRSLEDGVDVSLDLSGLVEEKDEWLIAKGEQAWKLLEIFGGAWKNASIKG